MQFRRMMLIPLALLFLGVGIAPLFQEASAEVVVATPSMGKYLKKSRAYRHDANGLLVDPQDGDTVWVGHIVGNNDIFGGSGYGPYHIGRTDEYLVDPLPPFGHGNKVQTHPGAPVDKRNNAYWDWDRWNAGEADSLQGWWPVACPYGSVGGSNVPDYRRAFCGLDYGNVGNYVINQGSPKRTFGVRSYWHRDGGGHAGAGAPGRHSCRPVHRCALQAGVDAARRLVLGVVRSARARRPRVSGRDGAGRHGQLPQLGRASTTTATTATTRLAPSTSRTAPTTCTPATGRSGTSCCTAIST